MARTFTLHIEAREPFIVTDFAAVESALAGISPTGASFVILSNDSGSYIQAAGARLRLTVEFREVTSGGFRHFVVGKYPPAVGHVGINYSSGVIRVRANEVLSARAAVDIFRSFFTTGRPPSELVVKDTDCPLTVRTIARGAT